LFVRERFDDRATQRDDADCNVVSQERYAQNRAKSFMPGPVQDVFWVGQNIRHLNRASFESGPARYGTAIRCNRIFVEPSDLLRANIFAGGKVIATAFKSEDENVFRVTQFLRRLSYGVEHRLNVGGRTGNDIEHLADCRLIFE